MSPRTAKLSASVTRRWLDQLVQGGSYVASESDRWFLATVGGVQRGSQRTTEGIGALGQRLVQGARRRLGGGKTRVERIRSMLREEVHRSELDLTDEEVVQFTENMSMLLELVLDGTIPVSDVAIQCDPGDLEESDFEASDLDPEIEVTELDDDAIPIPASDGRPPEG